MMTRNGKFRVKIVFFTIRVGYYSISTRVLEYPRQPSPTHSYRLPRFLCATVYVCDVYRPSNVDLIECACNLRLTRNAI